MIKLPIRQIAYYVPDVRAAAARHAAAFGSGPYFVADHIPLRACRHRGREAELDHSSAYGQWGELMIEFVQQNNPGPSAFHDLYPAGGQGLHHVAIIVDALEPAQAAMEAAGYETALWAEMNDGFRFVMMDASAELGHMIELYEGVAALTGFYDLVKEAARDFDGTDLVRTISFD